MTAALYILDTRAKRLIPAVQITEQERVDQLHALIGDTCQRETEIEKMIRDLRHDAVQCAIARRRLQNELHDAQYAWRRRS